MNEQDRELAPMVDGLSSGLCMLILIATVFMISAINLNVANTQGDIQFTNSDLDMANSTVYLYDGLNLSRIEFFQISEQINKKPGKTLDVYGFYPGSSVSSQQKLVYNFLVFKQGIKTDKKVNFVKSDSALCHNRSACIHWEVR